MALLLSPWARVSEPKYKEGAHYQLLEEDVPRLVRRNTKMGDEAQSGILPTKDK